MLVIFLTLLVLQVLLIGGSTGIMLEALEVVGDGHEGSLVEVSLPVTLSNFPSNSLPFFS